jgi:hypothetical protein
MLTCSIPSTYFTSLGDKYLQLYRCSNIEELFQISPVRSHKGWRGWQWTFSWWRHIRHVKACCRTECWDQCKLNRHFILGTLWGFQPNRREDSPGSLISSVDSQYKPSTQHILSARVKTDVWSFEMFVLTPADDLWCVWFIHIISCVASSVPSWD